MARRIRLVLVCSLFVGLVSLVAQDLSLQMDERYAPYADWQDALDLQGLAQEESDAWWKSLDEIIAERRESDLPLSGLHIALDPGHVGGDWAEEEGRHFQIDAEDYPVREGELVLEVAQRLREALQGLGAQVSLLREDALPLNPKAPGDYLQAALRRNPYPDEPSLASLTDYALALRSDMIRSSIVIGELMERARLVNEEVRPDAVLSLHINAAKWPVDELGEPQYRLVDSNHTHVLVFGCMSDGELSSPQQQVQLKKKLTNSSGPIEAELGHALGVALGEATGLPASQYSGRNAVLLEGRTPYLWARNLMLLRYIECPVVLLEPYVANSEETYPRLQDALRRRAEGVELADDDILIEYTGAVVAGLLSVYGSPKD